MSPSHCPALHCQKLTHKPHGDVTQNEEEEEDTADDICAAPWREMGETFGEGMLGRGCSMVWRSRALESWGMLESRHR